MGRRITGIKATKLFKSIMPAVYWCEDLGVPLFGASRVSQYKLRRIRMVPPGDLRPAFKRDKEVLEKIIEETLGRDVSKRFFSKDSLVLLNKVQAIDAADEVIIDGYSIGIREYDIYHRRWNFKPMYYGVKILVDEELGVYGLINRGHVEEDEILRISDFAKRRDLDKEIQWIPFATVNKRLYGLAKRTGKGTFRVVKVWKLPKKINFEPKKATLDDAIKANIEHLEYIEKDAIEFLKKISGYGQPLINISGGKDSTATAYLANLAGYNKAMFLDTCIEFPETIETVKKVCDELGLDVIWIDTNNVFWKALDVYGPPARDYRWCCKIVKLSYVARVVKKRFGRIVSIVGQRQYESTARALAGRLAPSGSTAYDYVAAPIQHWTSLEVYMYIKYRKLPLNPLYEKGYERIGCYLCPTSRLAEIESVRETHRVLWNKWYGYLYRYAREHRLPKEWVEYGLWRWRFKYPAEIIHLVKRLRMNYRELLDKTLLKYASASIDFHPSYQVCRTISLNNISKVDLDRFTRYLKIVGLKGDKKDKWVEIKTKNSLAKVYVNGLVELCSKDKKSIIDIAKKVIPIVYMVGHCYGCGLCEIICPYRAIKLGKVDELMCISCRKCMNICPSASQLSRHAIKIIELTLT